MGNEGPKLETIGLLFCIGVKDWTAPERDTLAQYRHNHR